MAVPGPWVPIQQSQTYCGPRPCVPLPHIIQGPSHINYGIPALWYWCQFMVIMRLGSPLFSCESQKLMHGYVIRYTIGENVRISFINPPTHSLSPSVCFSIDARVVCGCGIVDICIVLSSHLFCMSRQNTGSAGRRADRHPGRRTVDNIVFVWRLAHLDLPVNYQPLVSHTQQSKPSLWFISLTEWAALLFASSSCLVNKSGWWILWYSWHAFESTIYAIER